MTTKITLHLTKKDVAEYCIRSAYFRMQCNDDILSEKHLENSKTRIFSFLFTRTVHFCPNIFILSRDPVPLKRLFSIRPLWNNPEGRGLVRGMLSRSTYYPLIWSILYGSFRIITILNWWNVWKHPHGLPNCEVHNVNIRDWGHIRDENIVWRQHGLYNVMHPSQHHKQQHMQKPFRFRSFSRAEIWQRKNWHLRTI